MGGYLVTQLAGHVAAAAAPTETINLTSPLATLLVMILIFWFASKRSSTGLLLFAAAGILVVVYELTGPSLFTAFGSVLTAFMGLLDAILQAVLSLL